jgi:hypothetical protein
LADGVEPGHDEDERGGRWDVFPWPYFDQVQVRLGESGRASLLGQLPQDRRPASGAGDGDVGRQLELDGLEERQ